MSRQFFPILLLMAWFLGACGILQATPQAEGPITAVPLVVVTPEIGSPATEQPGSGLRLFRIDPEQSEVRFELDEDLRGQRTTVVGRTNQIAGEIALDLQDLASVEVGVIKINARTLATDNDLRNRAIRNSILETATYEFIRFTPSPISGLPASASIGEMVTFTLEGQLTIRDTSQPVIFDVQVVAQADGRLSGTARAVIRRSEFGLSIPSVPNVANVEEEVELYIDFVALAA
jgi:polyisoprenoid-binding protein YceI